ncbi:MAG: MFS transporter [Ignavibacteria bacterium]|nr:MFS transporter [Ignavibacteria bacterium]
MKHPEESHENITSSNNEISHEVTFVESDEIKAELSRGNYTAERNFSIKKTFTALKYPNYKLWFWGQMVSLFGTWMQITAQGFLIYDLAHSPAYLGYVGFASGIPTWIFMLYGGVIADRLPKRKILIYTQTTMMILAGIIAVLTFFHIVQPWHVIVLAFLTGTANAFDAPSRISLVNELVEKADLTNAIALNSTMFNTATAIGPAVAGLAYAFAGPAWCFTINAVSYIGVIIALNKMKMKDKIFHTSNRSAIDDIKEGLKYIAANSVIRTLILLVASISLFGLSFATLLPAWAVNILGGDSATNGFLQSARGAGALLSALFIASQGRFDYKGKILTIGSIGFPVLMFIFSFVHKIPLSLFNIFLLGIALILAMNIANALVQSLVPDKLRGRVMAVYTLTFFGFLPIGALVMGMLAEKFGEAEAILLCSLVTLSISLYIYFFIPTIKRLK